MDYVLLYNWMFRPPTDCVQYYLGALSGTVVSYNWGSLQMLASQHYSVCIRQELGESLC
jgi:hypothetical protein